MHNIMCGCNQYNNLLDTLDNSSSDKTSVDTPRELLEGKTTQFYIGTEVCIIRLLV